MTVDAQLANLVTIPYIAKAMINKIFVTYLQERVGGEGGKLNETSMFSSCLLYLHSQYWPSPPLFYLRKVLTYGKPRGCGVAVRHRLRGRFGLQLKTAYHKLTLQQKGGVARAI